ncbi:ankyrin repeat domain-containing protein [Hufsiella ginkgonis]|uniref:Ankyrin repeat domain-containing protein n=1 Tax=Hufsiella ginkgonis TaxID=2695274 RepID=A0A7K1XUR1_9SPHI|nr:ankyrin repeat domain-containing protein [Hufsiella ginkgonis]MXV14509.1 ankyrin repeat domain-containing protein [Hufsiella ginkgonis]
MKKLIFAVLALISLQAGAQQNRLLESAFWQSSPDVAAVKAEIDKGSSPSQPNGSSFDPVTLAINASAPNASIIYLLGQPGNPVDKLTHDGRNYLHWATSRGNVEIVEYLLNKGAKIDAQDSRGTTPLFFGAGSQQNTKVYEAYIAHGVDLKKQLNSTGANLLLASIAADKDFALTNYFISKGMSLNSVDAEGNNAFGYAARSGNIELLKKLLEKGVKPNPNAILMAAQGGRLTANAIELFQYLESLGIKANVVSKTGENALHGLVRRPGQAELIKYFLSKGADVNKADEDGNTVFMNAAASNRDTATLALLLPAVKNINQANQLGLTALTMAVRGNSSEVVNFLVNKGAKVNVLDKKGNNLAYYVLEAPMSVMGGGGPRGGGAGAQGGPGAGGREGQGGGPGAGQGGGSAVAASGIEFDNKLNILKQQGLNVTAPQADGNTLIHLAAAKNSLPLLKRLESLGIDVNAKNREGLTALHKAALVSKDDVILKYLLSIGAKKDAVTNFKETAFDLASENEVLTKNNVSVNFLK